MVLICSSIAILLSAGAEAAARDGPALAQHYASIEAGAPVPAASPGAQEVAGPLPSPAASEDETEFALRGYGPALQSPPWRAPLPAPGPAPDPIAFTDAGDAPQRPIPFTDTGDARTASMSVLYVSTRGVDSNPGSAGHPFRTLARAARAARPGTTIYVAPGTYSGGIQTTASGTPTARIAYVSSTRWGARLVAPADSRSNMAWDNRGHYVDIVGFEIDGSIDTGGRRWTHGIYSGGSYGTIRYNHVHHLAQDAPCTSAGGSAIGVDGYYRGVQSHVLANLVHDVGPSGCRYFQGIYFSTTGSIKNNVVYRVAEGAIHLWHDARNVVIANNTVAASNTGIIVGGGDYYHSAGPNDYTQVVNNIVVDNRMGVSEQGQTGRNNSYRNNLVYRNTDYDFSLKNGLTPSGTVSKPPGFVSGAADAAPDFRLRMGSAAIGRASAALADSNDFEGKPRNAHSGIDIGAFQHR